MTLLPELLDEDELDEEEELEELLLEEDELLLDELEEDELPVPELDAPLAGQLSEPLRRAYAAIDTGAAGRTLDTWVRATRAAKAN